MRPFQSAVLRDNDDFKDNYRGMTGLLAQLRERLGDEQAQWQGEARHTERYQREGKLLARERIELLLDDDSPFLEICALAGFDEEEGVKAGSTAIGGVGFVCGVMCVVTANVGTIKGGTVTVASMERLGRMTEIAIANRLPMIKLTESGGADLRIQAQVFHRGGAGFYHQAHLSKAGIPQISVVFGNATAGGAYGPGMSDYTVMVKERGLMFLGGPPLVKMATGEEAEEEALGGALMHSTVSGVSDYMALSEGDAIRKARQIVSVLNIDPRKFMPQTHWQPYDEPAYSSDDLLGIVAPNLKRPFDMREIVARLVDGSRWSEFKPLYGASIMCAWARIQGFLIGIIANREGVIFSDSALKATQFILLCNQKSTPILFLHNVTGFMVGTKYEQGGIIKHGSQMINAVSNSQVPHISVIVGSSYGAGNYAMCGRQYRPRFLWVWPQSRCAVMGVDQLAGVLDIVAQKSIKQRGINVTPEQLKDNTDRNKAMANATADPYYTSSRCIDDGIIDPRDTRTVLGLCLEAVHQGQEVVGGNTFGISRL